MGLRSLDDIEEFINAAVTVTEGKPKGETSRQTIIIDRKQLIRIKKYCLIYSWTFQRFIMNLITTCLNNEAWAQKMKPFTRGEMTKQKEKSETSRQTIVIGRKQLVQIKKYCVEHKMTFQSFIIYLVDSFFTVGPGANEPSTAAG